ncbi:TonB-linked SusC/RagA family outer membrane protein [Arcticibacter tournemirensis]|uniref:SusC/RagA family TonB-linked outer membrane protein n=1 Tax=Arcticibacter tournemirensis TaxID=699437 RepID=A0A5M9HAT0_9SPHI|nr:SusC/RagA family TonB-linked outer membrane protein [Arcticibacter tournemirensis]KAA8484092.1 SusC/RagA family TonB-linked outer membrane protein [Arcticibacter tournemirensis]TQM51829.1 TonB-linked SusC/RagA family outer membrane protein [Arcticibacter tournemirensis]
MKVKILFLIFFLALLSLHNSSAQERTISGSVRERGVGDPLIGVNISSNKGAKAITNESGAFRIRVNTGDTLSFTYLGYQLQRVAVTTETTPLTVYLSASSNSLNEVVVTALGVSKARKSLGYAVQEIKSGAVSTAKSTNLVNALSGKVAGVRVTNSQGNMGSSRIVIRGETSISNNNQPLFIVDNVPVDNSQLGAGGSRDYANAISDLNSEDIESISVLKGPTAAALYGSRAAHGVVLIKTKSGRKKEGLGITLNSNNVFDKPLVLPEYQDVFGQGANGQFSYVDGNGGGLNDNVDESWGPKMDGRLIPQFGSNGVPVPFVPHPDNVKDYFETGFLTDNGISIADAADKYNYRVSFNNSHQTGITPNTKLNKRNVSFNTSFKLDPRLTLTTTGNYFITDAPNLPGVGGRRATSTMLQFAWFGRQVDIDKLKESYFSTGSPNNWNNAYYPNLYFGAYENTVQQRRDRITGNVGLKYDINSSLSVNFRSGVDNYNDRRKLRIAYGTSGTPFGSYQETGYKVNENNTELNLNYDRKINSDFTVNALAGANLRNNTYEENDQRAPRLAVANVYTLANSRDPLVSASVLTRRRVYSVYGSAQLGFRDYAFINVTGRNDWSSTLPAEHRSYFYPSVNGTLVWSDLLKIQSNIFSYGKIRAGWAKVGADADPYKLLDNYNFGSPFNGYPVLTTSGTKNNPLLQPEMTTSTELGLEAGFFSGRVRLDLSVYNTRSKNQILEINVTPTAGYNKRVTNIGEIKNKGLEVQLGLTPIKTKAFQWDADINFAANRSRTYDIEPQILGTDGTAQVIAASGRPYGTIVGIGYLRDSNGNIVVGEDGLPQSDPTLKELGHFPPNWIGGINNSFSYKKVSLSFLIDASIGGSLYSGTNSTGDYTGVLRQTLPGRDKEHGGLEYYYPGNDKRNPAMPLNGPAPAGVTVYDDGIIFAGVGENGSPNTQIIAASQYYKSRSSIDEQYVYSASYVKFRELKLGYAFNPSFLKKIGLQNAVVSLVGRNLFIIHKEVPNIDPETAFNTGNGQGLEDLTYPSTRSFGLNLNLKF